MRTAIAGRMTDFKIKDLHGVAVAYKKEVYDERRENQD